MPQIQMLGQENSFSSDLGQALGSGLGQAVGGGISSKLNQMLKQKQSRNALEGLLPIAESQGIQFSPEQRKAFVESGLDPQTAGSLLGQMGKNLAYKQSQEGKIAAKEYNELQKRQREEQEVAKEQETLQNSFSELEQLIPYTGEHKIPGFKSFTAGGLNRNAVQNREKFTKLAFWLTDKTFSHFNKGTLSVPKFKELKESLAPRADLSERENMARLEAMKDILGLPKNIPAKELNKIIEEKKSSLEKSSEKPPMESFLR